MKDFARASALYGFSEHVAAYGLDPTVLLTEAGLPLDFLARPEGLMSYRRFLGLLDRCAALSGDPLFGLKLGLRQGTSVFGPILFLLSNAGTVGEALAELRQYFHLHMGAANVELVRVDDAVELSYRVLDPTQPGLRQGAELAIGVGIRLMKMLTGRNARPWPVLFAHAPGDTPERYAALLGVTPHFDAERSALVLKQADLAWPLSDADPALHTLIRGHLESMERLTDLEVADYVGRLLPDLLPQGRVTVGRVASCMAMSRRTLQRRLRDSGTTFQRVLDQSRQAVALAYLRDSRLQVSQLAELLGYTEVGAFTRAFTRWFGVPPSAWRLARKAGARQASVAAAPDTR